MKRYIIYILLVFIAGCTSEPSSKVNAADAIDVIKKTESFFPGTSTAEAITGLLNMMKNKGTAVDVIGWSQEYKSGGTHNVFFKVKLNDELSVFQWQIKPDGLVVPANTLALNVTKANASK